MGKAQRPHITRFVLGNLRWAWLFSLTRAVPEGPEPHPVGEGFSLAFRAHVHLFVMGP